MSWHAQEVNWGGKVSNRPISVLSSKTSFQAVAKGFENGSERVERIEDIKGAVKRCESQQGPFLIDLVVSESPMQPGLESLVTGNAEPSNPPYFST